MSRRNKHLLVLAVSIAAMYSLPAAAVKAKVRSVGTYTSGAIFVYFDRPVADCSTIPRIDIPAGDPSSKYVLAIATTAFATDSDVEVRVGSCSGQYPHWSPAGDTYIYLTK